MGIREKINENQGLAAGIAAAIVVLALIVIIFQFRPERRPDIMAGQAFFSVDDGETFFAHDINEIPPFEYRGQMAYRAQVFTCDGGRTKFVGYLEGYTEEARAELEQQRQGMERMIRDVDPDGAGEVDMWTIMSTSDALNESRLRVKRPGEDEWVVGTRAPGANEILTVTCPDGTRTNLARVFP